MAPIPITIITGFLGAGKTTMILKLLPQLQRSNPAYRLAILKNEFGDVAVDSQLAAAASSAAAGGGGAVSGVRELLNGCICCNLVGQLADALAELCGTATPPDRVIVETSGSAFPATLVFEINRLARETGGQYVLDGVVSVIDVENWRGYEDTSYTAKLQARYTDLIVFNKWESCGERRFDEVLDRVGDLGLETPWVKSDKGWVDQDVVFGVDGGLVRRLVHGDADAEADEHHDHDHDHDNHEHADGHHSEVEVLSVALKGPKGSAVNAAKLQTLLKSAPREEVYRIKAVLTASSTVRNSDEDDSIPTPPHPPVTYILNWAFGRWTFTPIPEGTQEDGTADEYNALRMTIILARYESAKWQKKLETGRLLELETPATGTLHITRIS